MKRLAMKLLVTVFAVFLLAACGPLQTPPAPDLGGTSWTLSSLGGKLPIPGTTITLAFGDDGSASGSDGCNSYSTTYTTDGDSISFGEPMAAGLMACPEPILAQASDYATVLADASEFSVDDTQLTLRDGRKVLATYVLESQELAGTSWTVTSYNNGRGGVVSVIIGSEIRADFSASGDVTGNAGCNDYFGTYIANESEIAFGPLGTTRKACQTPPGVMEQEAEYLAALETAASYTVEGQRMVMRTADGSIAVQLNRKASVSVPDPQPGAPTARVTARGGVNVRSGPGTHYPILGVAPFGAEGEIVGVSADGQWWAVSIPSAINGVGWVSADLVAASNANNVPVMAAPDAPVYPVTPAPAPTAVPPLAPPTATPEAEISFSADQTTINEGTCTNLNWSVENVRAVWVYPQGQPYQQYPRTGQGNEQVCPTTTTTYEIRVQMRDGSVFTQQLTINVVAATPAPVQNPLANTSWLVTSYNNGQQAVVSVLADTQITANFSEDNQVTGTAGCNNYFGSYTVTGSNITVGPLGSAQALCADPAGIMEQESQYLAALQSATTYVIDGNNMDMRAADGTQAVTLVKQ